jgi:hypothetical protein
VVLIELELVGMVELSPVVVVKVDVVKTDVDVEMVDDVLVEYPALETVVPEEIDKSIVEELAEDELVIDEETTDIVNDVVVVVGLKTALMEVVCVVLDEVIPVLHKVNTHVAEAAVAELDEIEPGVGELVPQLPLQPIELFEKAVRAVVDAVVDAEMVLVVGFAEVEVVVDEVGQVPPGTFNTCPTRSASQSTPGLTDFKVSRLTVKLAAILEPSSPAATVYVHGRVIVWFEHCTDL